jgi:hypothetical protein
VAGDGGSSTHCGQSFDCGNDPVQADRVDQTEVVFERREVGRRRPAGRCPSENAGQVRGLLDEPPLTQQERRRIALGLADDLAYTEIARRLDRPTSTITREVMRRRQRNGRSGISPSALVVQMWCTIRSAVHPIGAVCR